MKHRKYLELNPKHDFNSKMKRIVGPKITTKKTINRHALENEFEKINAPGPTSYNQDDRILHEKLRDQVWGKMAE